MDLRMHIAQTMKRGPVWKRSLQRVKSTVDQMIRDGFVEPCAPPGLKVRNMIRLTDAGRARFFPASKVGEE